MYITNVIPSELKSTNTWLVSLGYNSTLTSIENITKAVQRLPNYLRQTFYRHTREIIETKVISLLEFELWLGNRMKELYNPIDDIIASQESNRKKDPLKTINAGHTREKEEVKCWFCSKRHKITTCEEFMSSSINAKNEFVKANKLCWNCLGKGHNTKNCQSKHRCKVANCNKRHHTLLHNGNITPPLATSSPLPFHQAPQSNPNDAVNSNHFELSKTFLQILPVIITNDTKIVHTNALLDAGSDDTLRCCSQTKIKRRKQDIRNRKRPS